MDIIFKYSNFMYHKAASIQYFVSRAVVQIVAAKKVVNLADNQMIVYYKLGHYVGSFTHIAFASYVVHLTIIWTAAQKC